MAPALIGSTIASDYPAVNAIASGAFDDSNSVVVTLLRPKPWPAATGDSHRMTGGAKSYPRPIFRSAKLKTARPGRLKRAWGSLFSPPDSVKDES
jgi:hypothetical protein